VFGFLDGDEPERSASRPFPQHVTFGMLAHGCHRETVLDRPARPGRSTHVALDGAAPTRPRRALAASDPELMPVRPVRGPKFITPRCASSRSCLAQRPVLPSAGGEAEAAERAGGAVPVAGYGRGNAQTEIDDRADPRPPPPRSAASADSCRKRGGEQHIQAVAGERDQQVDGTERQHLRCDCAIGAKELRKVGEEEERNLRVQQLRNEPLGESAPRTRQRLSFLAIRAPPGEDTEQVSCAIRGALRASPTTSVSISLARSVSTGRSSRRAR
jgi:hypothetical protein